MNKTFLTYKEQINFLRNNKQLTISDEEYAEKILSKMSYYALIGGYKNLFKHAPSGKYIYGVTLEELLAFYYFDEELRILFLKYILHVERNIKSLLSYYFCEKHGENQFEYLSAQNYTITKKNYKDVNRLINSLNQAISLPSHYNYITHHAKTYGNIPLWVAVNTFTFGQISKMYQYMPNDIQTKISLNFGNISERQLHQFLRVLASCRNVCAHGERLYSFNINESIPNLPLHKKLQIPFKNGQYINGKHDLFAVFIALRYLIDYDDFIFLKTALTRLMKDILDKCPHINEEKLLNEMGFSKSWNKIMLFKI